MTTTLSIAQIRADGGTQSRAALDDPTIADYRAALADGATLPPLTVFHDGESYWLADGFHRVAYHGRLPFAAPLACDVRDSASVLHRAEYVAGSMLENAGARYIVNGVECELGRDGVLRAVASAERRAA